VYTVHRHAVSICKLPFVFLSLCYLISNCCFLTLFEGFGWQYDRHGPSPSTSPVTLVYIDQLFCHCVLIYYNVHGQSFFYCAMALYYCFCLSNQSTNKVKIVGVLPKACIFRISGTSYNYQRLVRHTLLWLWASKNILQRSFSLVQKEQVDHVAKFAKKRGIVGLLLPTYTWSNRKRQSATTRWYTVWPKPD